MTDGKYEKSEAYLNERRNLTELRVISLVAGDCRKLNRQPRFLGATHRRLKESYQNGSSWKVNPRTPRQFCI
jgi:hypothetical protein